MTVTGRTSLSIRRLHRRTTDISNSSEQALNVIETHIGDLLEEDAFLVSEALSKRFGWQGTVMTEQDVRTRIVDYYEFPLEPEQVDSLVSAVKGTRAWSRYMVDHMVDEAFEHVDVAIWEAARTLDIDLDGE